MSHFGRFPGGPPVRAFDGKASVMTQNRHVKEEATIRLHSKTFSAWCNVHLRKRQLRVNDVTTDFSDGILLISLIEILSNQPCTMKYNQTPKLEIQKVENVSIALQFINKFTKVNVNPKDVVSGNAKVILAILWRLIVTFQMSHQSSSNTSTSAVAMKREIKNKLTAWVRDKTGQQVPDCDRSFDDGIIFCRLVHAFDPSLIDLARVQPNRPRENLEMAFHLIEQHLRIPRMLSSEDMLNPDITARPDEQCVMTYLSQFPEAFLQRPTPEAIPVSNVSLDNLPTNPPATQFAQTTQQAPNSPFGYAQVQEYGKNQTHHSRENEGSTNHSLSSHPSLSNVSDSSTSDRSQSSFPQLPVEEKKSRYVIGDNLPLPPTMSVDSLLSAPPANSPYPASGVPSNSNQNQLYNQQQSNVAPSSPYGAATNMNQPGSNSSPFSGRMENNSPQSLPQLSNPYGTAQPQRPPPPSGGFGEFMGSGPSQPNMGTMPARPPPPSMSAFGLSSDSVSGGANSSQSQFGSMQTPPPQSDWQQKEMELRKREEEFQRQREEFERQKIEHEREMERVRRESIQLHQLPDNSQVEKLQSELSQLRENSLSKLTLDVISARNLLPGSLTGLRNPYAIIIVDNQKEKTTVIKRTIHPTWNSEFSFYIENPNWNVNVTIYDRSKLTHDDFLGKVVVPIRQLQRGSRREEWLTLQPKKAGANVSGEIRLGFLLS